MADLDRGGTFRQTKRVYMGPSVGWVEGPDQVPLSVTTTGTTVVPAVTYTNVNVNVNGSVTIQLPSAIASILAISNPGTWIDYTLTVQDIGGFAAAHPITILPFGSELFDKTLSSLQITNNYGLFTFSPFREAGGWKILT